MPDEVEIGPEWDPVTHEFVNDPNNHYLGAIIGLTLLTTLATMGIGGFFTTGAVVGGIATTEGTVVIAGITYYTATLEAAGVTAAQVAAAWAAVDLAMTTHTPIPLGATDVLTLINAAEQNAFIGATTLNSLSSLLTLAFFDTFYHQGEYRDMNVYLGGFYLGLGSGAPGGGGVVGGGTFGNWSGGGGVLPGGGQYGGGGPGPGPGYGGPGPGGTAGPGPYTNPPGQSGGVGGQAGGGAGIGGNGIGAGAEVSPGGCPAEWIDYCHYQG